LTDDISGMEIPGYSLITSKHKVNKSGGLAIYCSDFLSYKQLDVPNNNCYESMYISVSYSNDFKDALTIGNIYRPPRDNLAITTDFVLDFENVLTNLSDSHQNIIVCGDYNINLLKVGQQSIVTDYFDSIMGAGYEPKVILPTRIQGKSCTLIDNIFSKINSTSFTDHTMILLSGISDHFPCIMSIDVKYPNLNENKYITIRKETTNSITNILSDLNETQFTQILNTSPDANPEENYKIFHNTLLNIINKHIPHKKVKFNKYKHKKNEWITIGILKSIKHRDNLLKDMKSCNVSSNQYVVAQKTYKDYKSILQKVIRKSKELYYQEYFTKNKDNMSKTWRKIKDLTSKKTSDKINPHFIINGSIKTDEKEIADNFNNYFLSIATNVVHNSGNLPASSFSDYLTDSIESTFAFSPISEVDLLEIVNSLKLKSSYGYDKVSTNLLFKIFPPLISPLTLIINQSLISGIFPSELKIARIKPLYKKNNPECLENYRPISLLPSLSKLFEKAMYNQIYSYFDNSKLFYPSQYGFKKKHSCEHAVLETIDRILHSIDHSKTPFCVYMDLSKAFDVLNHNILLNKLEYYGFDDRALFLIRSYLSDRQQFVEFNSTQSDTKVCNLGVPQGSILGPLLFLIFINDINNVSNKITPICYADDTTLHSCIESFDTNIDNAQLLINEELCKFDVWLKVNNLTLNVSKTKYMLFGPPQKRQVNITLKIHGVEIEKLTSFNFLGIVVDQHLNWKDHINHIALKINRANSILRRLKNLLPCNILLLIYQAIINSHLNYGILAWGFNLSRITKLQKRSIRLVSGAKYNAHTEPIFKYNQVLKVEDIFSLRNLLLYYRIKNDLAPAYFVRYLIVAQEQHHYNTRRRLSQTLPCPRSNKVMSTKCTRFSLVNTVNNTPADITSNMSMSEISFKKLCKKYFTNNYKTQCLVQNCYICNRYM